MVAVEMWMLGSAITVVMPEAPRFVTERIYVRAPLVGRLVWIV